MTGTHTLASMMIAVIISAPINPSCPNSGVGDAGLKKMALMNRMVNVTAAPQNPTTPMNFASESSCLSSGVGSSLFPKIFLPLSEFRGVSHGKYLHDPVTVGNGCSSHHVVGRVGGFQVEF